MSLEIADTDCGSFILSRFTEDHISDEYISWFNDAEVCQFNRHGEEVYDREKALAYYRAVKNDISNVTFAIIDKLNLTHIGNVSLSSISQKNLSAEIAIIIGNKSYWGKGIGFKCFEALTQYGFNHRKLHKIKIGFFTENNAMRKICLKLGFEKEAVLRDEIRKEGKFITIEQWAKFSTKIF